MLSLRIWGETLPSNARLAIRGTMSRLFLEALKCKWLLTFYVCTLARALQEFLRKTNEFIPPHDCPYIWTFSRCFRTKASLLEALRLLNTTTSLPNFHVTLISGPSFQTSRIRREGIQVPRLFQASQAFWTRYRMHPLVVVPFHPYKMSIDYMHYASQKLYIGYVWDTVTCLYADCTARALEAQ